ncbi:MAG TPA: sigma-70 family RNA polymerase sigma factor [Acidimicrobiales bacterium]
MALITDLDDRTLVEQHRSGDPEAFRRIVIRHHRSLYANALRRLGDPVAAEDAVQDAFLRAFRNIEHFDGDYHLDAWLHRIVTNTCHDIGRRRGRDTRLFDRACTQVEVEVPPADEAFDAMPRAEIAEALDSLPESYREVLVLRFVDELSYSDVAEQAGISEENARARVSRGRTMLKRMLTSTSALGVWMIPPLRRQAQLGGAEAEAANQAASQRHGLATIAASAPAPTQAFTQLSGIIAQAGPALATAAPAVSSTAPTLGKAAIAVGIAASVAIPAGVAVDRAGEQRPAPAAAAPAEDDSSPVAVDAPVELDRKPTSSQATLTAPVVAASSTGDPTVIGATQPTPTVVAGTTPTSDPTGSTTSPTAGGEPAPTTGSTPTSSEPSVSPPAEEQPPPAAPVAGPPGQLSASVAITPNGSRLTLAGPLKLEIDGEVIEGQLSGKLLVASAGKDPQAPRDVERSELFLDLADGSQLVLVVKGTSTVTEDAGTESHALDLVFTLDRAADYGLADSGPLKGTLAITGDRGELGLAIPGATQPE